MRLAETGLTVQDIKDKVNKYMIETYERSEDDGGGDDSWDAGGTD